MEDDLFECAHFAAIDEDELDSMVPMFPVMHGTETLVLSATVVPAGLPDTLISLTLVGCTLPVEMRWPTGLVELILQDMGPVHVKDLPSSLREIRIAGSTVASLVLPPKLETLSMSLCKIAKLPALPDSLRTLLVQSCGLKTLPRALPSALDFLCLPNNQIRRIPRLPARVTYCEVTNNPLLLPQSESSFTVNQYMGIGLRAYLKDLYAVQDNPASASIWPAHGFNVNEVADPEGKEAWDD